MSTLLSVVHIVTCVLIVLVVLIQQGKGAEISASFGGSSQTVFGSSGGANFFVKFTSALAVILMVTSVVLTILGGKSRRSIFEGVPAKAGTPPAASLPLSNPQALPPGHPPVAAPPPPAAAAPASPENKQAPAGNAGAPAR